ncbi:MAG: hypothetical protein ACXWD3_00500, partial [Mycobacterium sp.]
MRQARRVVVSLGDRVVREVRPEHRCLGRVRLVLRCRLLDLKLKACGTAPLALVHQVRLGERAV